MENLLKTHTHTHNRKLLNQRWSINQRTVVPMQPRLFGQIMIIQIISTTKLINPSPSFPAALILQPSVTLQKLMFAFIPPMAIVLALAKERLFLLFFCAAAAAAVCLNSSPHDCLCIFKDNPSFSESRLAGLHAEEAVRYIPYCQRKANDRKDEAHNSTVRSREGGRGRSKRVKVIPLSFRRLFLRRIMLSAKSRQSQKVAKNLRDVPLCPYSSGLPAAFGCRESHSYQMDRNYVLVS